MKRFLSFVCFFFLATNAWSDQRCFYEATAVHVDARIKRELSGGDFIGPKFDEKGTLHGGAASLEDCKAALKEEICGLGITVLYAYEHGWGDTGRWVSATVSSLNGTFGGTLGLGGQKFRLSC